jgi:hypothetical protein
MAKNIIAFSFLLAVLFCAAEGISQTCVEQVYLSQVGVREATGCNDGPAVECYLRNAGLGKGYAWCAAFVKWCFGQCGIRPPITAWAPSAHNAQNIVMMAGRYRKEPVAGDVFTIWNVKMKRIGHTGFFHRRVNEAFYETVEGNTNGGGSREGDGVYKRKRSVNSTYSITRWTNTK